MNKENAKEVDFRASTRLYGMYLAQCLYWRIISEGEKYEIDQRVTTDVTLPFPVLEQGVETFRFKTLGVTSDEVNITYSFLCSDIDMEVALNVLFDLFIKQLDLGEGL